MVNYKIAIKKSEIRTTWDLMQVFVMATYLGYKAVLKEFCISEEDERDWIDQQEGTTRKKLVIDPP